MSFIKCYDAVTMVTDEATKQFILYREDEDKKLVLRNCCNLIEKLAERFDGVSYETEVDNDSHDITISLVCGELEAEYFDEFYELMRKVKSISIENYSDEQLKIDFVFEGIWESKGI